MAVADRTGFLIAVGVGAASPHELTLVDATVVERFIDERPRRADRRPCLRQRFAVPTFGPTRHRNDRTSPPPSSPTQDPGRTPITALPPTMARQTAVGLAARLRRPITRHEYKLRNFLGFLRLGVSSYSYVSVLKPLLEMDTGYQIVQFSNNREFAEGARINCDGGRVSDSM